MTALAGKKAVLVTAALPYANGRLHVGHAAGAYLPADIYARFLRLTGRECVFICGSDENGAPITFSALKEGVCPQDVVDRYHVAIRDALAGLGVSFSRYGRTHTPAHDQTARDWFSRLNELGHIVSRETDQVYCAACRAFLPDRYIEGVCPHPDCRKPGARGDQCERCGRPVDAVKLADPECMVCKMRGRPARGRIEVRSTRHWYFKLDRFEKPLRDYLDAHPEWRDTVKSFSLGMLEGGLKERCITRDLDWGVPAPLPDAAGKVLYVWFDAPIGYVTFTKEHFAEAGTPERWKDFWRNPENGLVHFIGKDNTVFHTVIFPAMMLGHGGYRLADAVVVNEFLNLEGEKISTSRNHAVWVDEFLKDFPADSLRYYLCAIAPETSDSDFSWKQFQARNNGELADNLGNFIQRNLAFAARYFDGKVPAVDAPSPAGAAMLAEIDAARAEIRALCDAFRFKAALERLMLLSRRGNQYFAEEAPWQLRKTDMAACAKALYAGLRTVEALGVLMAPFLPFAAEKLRAALNLPPLAPGDFDAPWRLAGGRGLGTPDVLFPKYDDAKIDPHLERLRPKKEAETP